MKQALQKGLLLFLLVAISTHGFLNNFILKTSNNRKVNGRHWVTYPVNPKQAESIEENLGLESAFKQDSFLKNIKEYGNARMARRAVGVLQKMPSFRVTPTVDHYNEAIWACEKSDQYPLAMNVYEEMKLRNITPILYTYEALINVAEKTSHCAEALQLNEAMKEEGLIGSTYTFNACIWALEKMGESQKAFALFEEMDDYKITRDVDTYTACVWAAEKEADGELALRIMDIMKEQDMPMTTATYNGAMWACTKGGFWQDSLALFDRMELQGVPLDISSYNAAIWACEQGDKHYRAVELLKLMKFEGLERNTMSFDGVISAMFKQNDWNQIVELFRWMERDAVDKSHVTYRIAIDALDRAGKQDMIDEIYLQSLRDGYYSPWVKRKRELDVRSFSLATVKVALKMVLLAMKEGRLQKFKLRINVANVVKDIRGNIIDKDESFSVDELKAYLYNLDLHTSIRSRVEYDENDLIMKYQMRNPALFKDLDLQAAPGSDNEFVHLEVGREIEEDIDAQSDGLIMATEVLTLSKETIDEWVSCQNQWDE